MRTLRLPLDVRPVLVLLCAAACGPNETHPTTTVDPYRAGGEQPLACTPNLDGRIDADEMKPVLGARTTLLVSPAGETRTVELAGDIVGGKRIWDWSAHAATDQAASIEATAPSAHWFASSFPEAQFIAPIDAGATLLGAYRHSAEGIDLLGYASATDTPASSKTLVIYDAPARVYRFPLTPDASWVSSATTRNATIRGLPYAGRDTYEVKVAAAGRLELPDLAFAQALRVNVKVTIEPAVGASVSRRQVSFVFECFGEVARATSRDGETEEDFTTAAEVRRLGLGD